MRLCSVALISRILLFFKDHKMIRDDIIVIAKKDSQERLIVLPFESFSEATFHSITLFSLS